MLSIKNKGKMKMKKLLSIISALLMTVNMCTIYILAEEAETEEEVLDSFAEFISEENSLVDDDLSISSEEEKSPPCEATLEDEFEAGEVIVDIMRAQSAARQEYTAADFPGVDIKEISVIMNYYPDSNNHLGLLIKLNKQDKESVLEAVKVLEQNPIVFSACPNYIYEVLDDVGVEAANFSADAGQPSILTNITNEIDSYLYTYACCAKKYTDSNKNNTVAVGVLGNGIYDNKDISSKVVKYVNCADNNAEGYTIPGNSHDTIVANALARETMPGSSYTHSSCSNNIYSGVCTNVELYSLRISYVKDSENKTNLAYYRNAINYASAHNIKVLVCSSLLGVSERDSYFESTVNDYNGIIVSSASNISNGLYNNADIDAASNIVYPTSCPSDNVIVVGQNVFNNNTAQLGIDSCYGKNTVDLFAPGYIYDDEISNSMMIGASIATPRVAGAAAVLLNICPTLTKSQLRHYLLAGVDASTDLADKCVTGGSLNVYKSAKLLIADRTFEWKTVFAGHFTRTDKMQVAAYFQADAVQLKCYVWTYDKDSGKFSDPEHWFTNSQYTLEYAPNNSFNMHRSVAGDFDGDGYTEICTLYDWADNIFVVGNGYDVQSGVTNGLPVENFTGRVVALDYDNDGRDEIAALYDVGDSWGHTQLYTWDFDGVGTGMSATQRLCYDSGAGNYVASYTTDKVVAGDFDGDGAEELAAVYRYPETGKYSLHKFDIWTGGASYTNLIYKKDDIDASKIAGRVVSCNYDGDNIDDVVCMYDNSQTLSNGIINYGFRFTSGVNTWGVTQLYSSSEGVYDADRSTYLMLSGDFRNTGRDDIVTFYKIPIADLLSERTRIYMCLSPSMYGYNKVWDPTD